MQIKLVALLLAPLFARQGGWRKAWAGASVTALPFLPYAADVGNWLAGVGHFGSHLGFNGSVHALPSLASGSRAVALALCAALFVLWIMLVTLLENDFWRSGFSVMGGLIVLSPIVHYWYVSWALVFVPLFPSLAWLTLSGTIALYFLVGLTPDRSMPLWAALFHHRRIMGYGQNPRSLLRSNLVKFAPAVSNATRRSRRP